MRDEPSEATRQLLATPALFDKFTEHARHALALARQAARASGCADIRSEHLLLGLVRRGQGIAAHALARAGLDSVQLGLELLTMGQTGRGSPGPGGEPQLTEECKGIIAYAVADARRRKHHYIGTEHLLLGILAHPDCAASQFLVTRGFALAAVQAQVEDLLAQPEKAGPATPVTPTPASASGLKSNVVTCRLDDRTLEAVDSLVEAGIRSSRSDAVAWLIAAGIAAHGDLFARIQATVASIRQLRAEVADLAPPAASPLASSPPEPPTTPSAGD